MPKSGELVGRTAAVSVPLLERSVEVAEAIICKYPVPYI